MRDLNLPTYSFKIKSEEGQDYIFDPFRRKYVRLTPEEWVRQNFAAYLVDEKAYPSSRIVMEKSLSYNKMVKRCDILTFDRTGHPLLLVECKAPGVKLRPEVFDQIAVYNMVFRVAYLVVTNGLKHYCCKVDFDSRDIHFLTDIPMYTDIDR
ncbi:MAG TPA: type I restriction enzyme HsdR N-terminal domain-containing protein [Bacteroidales bacterium]|nr:type I restriction enzyme HsdR N-terminal domain-containing protein [Bacteroidales bacterium]